MAQRTDARAFYNEGAWKRRDARHHDDLQAPRSWTAPPKGTDHLPQPRFQGWTAENWSDAHIYRFDRPHTAQCPCQNAETALWRNLQAAGFLRPTRGSGEHAKSGDA